MLYGELAFQWTLGPSTNRSAFEMTHSYLARFSTGVTYIQCLTVSSTLICALAY